MSKTLVEELEQLTKRIPEVGVDLGNFELVDCLLLCRVVLERLTEMLLTYTALKGQAVIKLAEVEGIAEDLEAELAASTRRQQYEGSKEFMARVHLSMLDEMRAARQAKSAWRTTMLWLDQINHVYRLCESVKSDISLRVRISHFETSLER